MSANRILILVGVLIVVLYGISLALSENKKDESANPEASFFNKLNFGASNKLDLADVSARGGVLGGDGKWIIPNTVAEASLAIAKSKNGRKVRSMKLSLEAGAMLDIKFTPTLDTNSPPNPVDAGAASFTIKKIESGKPLTITLLEHGGTLLVRRAGPTPTVFKLD